VRRLLLLATALSGAALLAAPDAPGQTPPPPPTAATTGASASGVPSVALPDTVVTGTRVPTPEQRVPAAITVITRQDIEERGYQSLQEALTAVPGMNLVPTGGFGSQTSAFVRGNASRSVLVLIDGVPVNDPSEPNGAFNFGQDLLFDVERIEVFRGPASSLYGSAAIGGVINLVTRRAAPGKTFSPYGEFAAGSQTTVRGGVGATGQLGAFDYLLSGNGITSRGFNALAPRFWANIPERDGFFGGASAARLGWTPREGTRVEGLFRWRQNTFGLDNVPQDDPNYIGHDQRWYGHLRGETRLLDGAWTTALRIAGTQYDRRYVNQPDFLNPLASDDRYKGTRGVLDWGNTVRLPDLGGSFTDGAFAFGVTYMGEQAESVSGTPGFTTSVHANQHTTSGWGTVQYRAFGRLDLTAGIRQDSTTGVEGATTWRLGAVLALPEIASRIRAAGGTAFNAPSLFQRFGVIPGFFQGNPDLKPERSTAWEIGMETDIALFGRQDFATAGWTYFQSRLKDLINFNAQFDTLVNIDRADIRGAELGLTLRPARWLDGTIAWTITEAFDAKTGLRLPRRPETVITFAASIRPIPRLVIAPTVLFTGRSPEGPFAAYDNAGVPYAYQTTNKAGTVFNLTASYQVTDPITVFLEARNLTNQPFEPANGFVVPGRSVLVGTRFSL
jgi:vitamin B12 transporter